MFASGVTGDHPQIPPAGLPGDYGVRGAPGRHIPGQPDPPRMRREPPLRQPLPLLSGRQLRVISPDRRPQPPPDLHPRQRLPRRSPALLPLRTGKDISLVQRLPPSQSGGDYRIGRRLRNGGIIHRRLAPLLAPADGDEPGARREILLHIAPAELHQFGDAERGVAHEPEHGGIEGNTAAAGQRRFGPAAAGFPGRLGIESRDQPDDHVPEQSFGLPLRPAAFDVSGEDFADPGIVGRVALPEDAAVAMGGDDGGAVKGERRRGAALRDAPLEEAANIFGIEGEIGGEAGVEQPVEAAVPAAEVGLPGSRGERGGGGVGRGPVQRLQAGAGDERGGCWRRFCGVEHDGRDCSRPAAADPGGIIPGPPCRDRITPFSDRGDEKSMAEPNFELNALYAMDNLDLMRGMDSETVDLIYLDPPFNSKRMYQGMSGTAAEKHKFKDTWSWTDAKTEWLEQLYDDHRDLYNLVMVAKAHSPGMGGYICFMAPRVIEMHRILKPTGSIYLHCDPSANAFLRLLLDLSFGKSQFRNEISWHYDKWTNAASYFQRNHDTLLFYAKDDRNQFNKQYYMTQHKEKVSLRGWDSNVVQGGIRQLLVYDERKASEEIKNPKYDRIVYRNDANPGTAVPDVWHDIKYLASGAKERTGWRTQKPEALLERIIKASSNEGDIVFDPFCGCGTAMVVADRLGRRYLGADDDTKAIGVVQSRIADLRGIPTDHRNSQQQLKRYIKVINRDEGGEPPERTDLQGDEDEALPDPTGEKKIVSKKPSERLSHEDMREKLIEWEAGKADRINCIGCMESLTLKHFQLDHDVPRSMNGSNGIENRILLCGPCNLRKSDTETLRGLWKNKNKISPKDQKDLKKRYDRIKKLAERHVEDLDRHHKESAQGLLREP